MSRMSTAPASQPADAAPYFDPETTSVGFHAPARGGPVRAFVTREWLVRQFGKWLPEDARVIEAYLEHATEIDAEVARRYAQGRPEPIWLASAFSPID